MKMRKHRPITTAISGANREHEVQQEIETFLAALNSYPDRFACNPCLSFEQHLFSLATARPMSNDPRRTPGAE
jgi:hypothetical protein